jgi:hypothetical protein
MQVPMFLSDLILLRGCDAGGGAKLGKVYSECVLGLWIT